ncbi:MAG: serine hydrolase, partial [Bacteroidaceae bacterium]|nr:serine hydrolase [Bacteroidaceae bacterium]
MFSRLIFTVSFIVLAGSSAQARLLSRVKPESAGMNSAHLSLADSALNHAISAGEIPGAVLAVVRHGKMAYLKAYGNRQTYPSAEEMTTNTIFDLASCSKSSSTAICAMQLIERGQMRLLDPVSRYLPGFQP